MHGNHEDLELNQIPITLSEFVRAYNKSIPEGFPRASAATLKKFQSTHAMFFRRGDMWSIDQHRKRVMDWLSSNRGIA